MIWIYQWLKVWPLGETPVSPGGARCAFKRSAKDAICTLKVPWAFQKNQTNEGDLIHQCNHHAFSKMSCCLSHLCSTPILSSFISPLDKDQYSEREAAQASPLFLGCDGERAHVCNADWGLPLPSPRQPHLLKWWEEHANLATLEQWLMPDGAGARPPPRRGDATSPHRYERRETMQDTPERKSQTKNMGRRITGDMAAN